MSVDITEPVQSAPKQNDYFGFSSRKQIPLPDGASYIEFNVMNEGQKASFQKLTQRDLTLERQSGNARMKVNPAEERHALLTTSICGWSLVRNGSPVPFSEHVLRDFLKYADPKIVELIEKEIRKANPWLLSEMSVKDIDQEIENLREMREIAEEREAGEASSSSR